LTEEDRYVHGWEPIEAGCWLQEQAEMQQQRRRQQLRDDGHRPGAGASPAGLDERRHARCSRPQAGHGNAGGVFTQHLAIAVSLQRVLWIVTMPSPWSRPFD
jgi:hypothetical protein